MIRTHNQENTQPENMCDIVFEKAKGRGGTVNRMSDYAQAAIRRVLLKRCYEKFRENSQENTCAEISFLIKSDAVDLQLC